MEAQERRDLIARYREGARIAADALASLSPDDLNLRSEGGWTVRDLIYHIADAELIEGLRLRRLLTEHEPLLPWPDEAPPTPYGRLEPSIETSVSVFGAAALANIALAQRLTPAQWLRSGKRGFSGAYGVEDWLRRMSRHARDHATQILRALRP